MPENIVSKSYRVLTDQASNTWDKVSLWTKASDVMNDATGNNLQNTVGAINGIANNLVTTQTGYGLDATMGKHLNDRLGGLSFGWGGSGEWGYFENGNFHPFGGKATFKFGSLDNSRPLSDYVDEVVTYGESQWKDAWNTTKSVNMTCGLFESGNSFMKFTANQNCIVYGGCCGSNVYVDPNNIVCPPLYYRVAKVAGCKKGRFEPNWIYANSEDSLVLVFLNPGQSIYMFTTGEGFVNYTTGLYVKPL